MADEPGVPRKFQSRLPFKRVRECWEALEHSRQLRITREALSPVTWNEATELVWRGVFRVLVRETLSGHTVALTVEREPTYRLKQMLSLPSVPKES